MKTLGTLLIGAAVIFATPFVQAQSSPGTTQTAPAGAAVPAASAPPSRQQQRQQQRQIQGRRHFQQSDANIQRPQAKPQQHPQPLSRGQLQQQPQQPQGANTDPAVVRRRHDQRGQGNPSHRPVVNFNNAVQRQHRQRHDRSWWHRHFTTIVFVHNCGYYYWDAGYWFPAFGYYPQLENFDYNGPIYTYGNLLPDQVIYNVQSALKELGYYSGPLSGSMSAATRDAISAFQEDNGLDITGAIDAPTVETLGLD